LTNHSRASAARPSCCSRMPRVWHRYPLSPARRRREPRANWAGREGALGRPQQRTVGMCTHKGSRALESQKDSCAGCAGCAGMSTAGALGRKAVARTQAAAGAAVHASTAGSTHRRPPPAQPAPAPPPPAARAGGGAAPARAAAAAPQAD